MSNTQYSYLNFLYAQTWVKVAEEEIYQSRDQRREIVTQRLSDAGLVKEQIEHLHHTFRKKPITKARSGIINPDFLRARTDKELYFFLVDARWGRYHPLQMMLQSVQGDISYFSLYGPKDSLIQLYGTRSEADRLFESLERSRFEPSFLEVKDIPYYYGHRLDSTMQINHRAMQVPIEIINQLVDDYFDPDIPDSKRKVFADDKVVLGPAVIEDLTLTGRIKAFVGINFIGNITPRISKNLTDYLLNKSDLLQKAVRSIYLCDGTPYDYLLQLVCDNPIELDQVTDLLNEDFLGASGLESSTFIVANAQERLPKYTETETLVLDISMELREEHVNFLQNIEQGHIAPLSRDLRDRYLALRQDERLFLLQAIDSFESYALTQIAFMEEEARITMPDFITSYIRGFIDQSVNQMSSTAVMLGTFVETASKKALREALTLVFPAHQLSIAQNDLKLPGANPDKFTLGKVQFALQKINDDPRYQRIGFQLDETFFEEFENFIRLRNRAAHGTINDLLRKDFPAGSRQIRDGYLKAYELLATIQQSLFDPDFLPEALKLALEQKSEIDGQLEEDIRQLVVTSDQILVEIMKRQALDRKRFHAILVQLNQIDRSVANQQEQQNKLIVWLQDNQEAIEEHIQPEENTRLQHVLQILITQGQNMPANVLANLIAALLAGLSQPYLSEILPQLLRLLR